MRLILAALLLAPSLALAHDPHHRADITDWMKSLKNGQGITCCDGNDAHELEWKAEGGHYSVKINGEWFEVPHDKVLSVPNISGSAKVWYSLSWMLGGRLVPTIRCFLPGILS